MTTDTMRAAVGAMTDLLRELEIASGDMIVLAGAPAFYDAKTRRDKARNAIHEYVVHLFQRTATSAEPERCPTCNGDDMQSPCAYPDEGKPGCPRDKRLLAASPTAAPALSRFNERAADLAAETPLERLRYFCSLAMNRQDWMDVEPFFDAIATSTAAPKEEGGPVAWMDEAKRLTHRLVHHAKLEANYSGGPLAAAHRRETQEAQSILFAHLERATRTQGGATLAEVPEGLGRIDALLWLERRAQVIDALANHGLCIVSTADATWLAALPGGAAFPVTQGDAKDAARYRWLRKGLPLTVVVPAPTEDKPNKKVTVSYGPNTEPAWGESLDRAIDATLSPSLNEGKAKEDQP